MTSAPPGRPFPRALLSQDTLDAARALLGARLIRDGDPVRDSPGPVEPRVGRIVEVEAYIGENDLASHARMGRTPRNGAMYGPPGHAYVYLVYGMHHCLNVVTRPAMEPAALLVRAVEPLAGLDAMRAARARSRARRPQPGAGAAARAARGLLDARLAAGPGLVAAAFDIDRSADGLDLCDPRSPLRLETAPDDEPRPPIVTSPRIGIGYAGEPWTSVPWRFVVDGSPSVSGPRGPRGPRAAR